MNGAWVLFCGLVGFVVGALFVVALYEMSKLV